LRAFWFCFGAPEPDAPPCIRQRFLPDTASDRQGPPKRVLAPQRGQEPRVIQRDVFTVEDHGPRA
jgi:hypothetical protein